MNVGAVLVADLQAPEAVEPGEGAFNHLAVAAQSVLGLDAATGNARNDAPLARESAADLRFSVLGRGRFCNRRLGDGRKRC
jgi:hypothetical protein